MGAGRSPFCQVIACRSAALVLCVSTVACLADEVTLHPLIEQSERERIAIAKKVTPATIAIFDTSGASGGSGVIVRADGLAVTNFHVVGPCGPFMTVGLPGGDVVSAVLLGVDPPGDVAVIQLLDDRDYPYAEIGDSDQARAGEEVFVVGNPFLLADDLQPTVTHGVLSGVRRYQYPSGAILEYADCLQTDAAINPGNSGGPLYNAAGELIGVNGRASFEKRGRVNVGVGYAISINQVMRFLSHLESGRIVDHAQLGATARTLARGRVVIDQIEQDSDAYRRGLRYGDQVVLLAGREVTSANQVQNIVATYPPGWRLPITCRRSGEIVEALVRLTPAHQAGQLEVVVEEQLAELKGKPPRAGVYEPRAGYANYLANRTRRDKLLAECPQTRDSSNGPWRLTGLEPGRGAATILLAPSEARYVSDRGEYWIDPTSALHNQRDPPGSGGLLASLGLWRTLLTAGPAGVQEAFYLGRLPWGGAQTICECVVVNQGAARAEFYFGESGDLIGIEFIAEPKAESCRVEFSGFEESVERMPTAMEVRHGDDVWAKLDRIRLEVEGSTE